MGKGRCSSCSVRSSSVTSRLTNSPNCRRRRPSSHSPTSSNSPSNPQLFDFHIKNPVWTIQDYCTVLYITEHYSSIQYSKVPVLHITVLTSTVLCSTWSVSD